MLTIGALASHNQRNWAGHTAYVDNHRRVTWDEFGERTDRLGHALRLRGIAPGDRVAILATDCIEMAEVFIACAKIGAVRVGFNHRLSAHELAQLIDDSQPAVCFVEDQHAALLAEARQHATHAVEAIPFGPEPRATPYEELVLTPLAGERLEQTPADLVMICYTTGSTGLPKGALYTHRNVVDSMMNIALCEGASHDDIWMHTMPAGGVPLLHLCRNLYHGSTTAILGRWDPDAALALIERERVTLTVLVPTMLNSLLAAETVGKTDTSSLKQLEYGASPLPPAVIREAMSIFGCPFLQMYGTTELTGMASMLFPSDHALGLAGRPEILASAGKPLPYVETRIVSPDGAEVPRGEIGELVVRTELTIPGYWGGSSAQYEEMVRDGWLHTGDLGYQDPSGYLFLVDRLKFRIKSGGYNIYPVEVENVLAEHPAVHEVSVVGVPDDKWGERVHAVVVLRGESSAGGPELIEFCRGRIADFKLPRSIDFWPELPKGPTGKIQKREILDRVTAAGGPVPMK